jgi:hypothetical protein
MKSIEAILIGEKKNPHPNPPPEYRERGNRGRWIWVSAFALLALAGCHSSGSSSSSNNVQTLSGTFEAGNNRILQVRMATPGTLMSDKILALDPKVEVVVNGKASTMTRLVIGQTVLVTQNVSTSRVVKIEAK